MLRFAPRATRDLDSILAYLMERSPAGARNVARSIKNAADLIAQYPRGGRFSGEQETRVVRAGRFPYLIYWEEHGDDVWIVHIRHTARRPWHGEPE